MRNLHVRNLITLGLAAALVAITASASFAVFVSGPPYEFSYQGRLTDALGNPVADGVHSVQFTLWDSPILSGPFDSKWTSGPVSVTTTGGLFSVLLGASPMPAIGIGVVYDSVTWLGIKVGADPEISPRTRIVSAPYALMSAYAMTAGLAYSVSPIDSTEIQTSSIALYNLNPAIVPAVGTATFSFATTSTVPVTLGQFTASAPGPGYFLVTVSGQWYLDADATSAAALTTYCLMGLCDSPGNSGVCGGTWNAYYVQDADNTDNNNPTHTLSITREFAVPSAGNYVYYLNGETTNPLYTLYSWGAMTASVIFVPNTLNVTSPAPNNSNVGPQQMK